MLLVMPVMAQAEVAEWKEITKGGNVQYNAGVITLETGPYAGLDCVTVVTNYYKSGVSTWGGGGGCNFQLYNCLYHGMCGGGSQNGATVNHTHPENKLKRKWQGLTKINFYGIMLLNE